jgi:putative DNA primase/helicase
LQSSCATGLPWLGLPVEPCNSVGFYTEDEDLDIDERQNCIDAAYGVDCRDQKFKMYLFPRVGLDNELLAFDRTGNPVLRPFYWQVHEAAMDLHARLVTLDVAVDLFAGHEIDRRQVRDFIRPIGALARDINGGVVLTAHVSQAGIRSDGGHSGSTDWSNAVRSRAYLSRPKSEKNGEPADTDERLLTRKKANLASIGDTIKLRWKNGILVPDGPIVAGLTPFGKLDAKDVFLGLLDVRDAQQRPVSAKERAGNFAPRVFDEMPREQRYGYQFGDFKKAMESLFFTRTIEVVPYGRASKGMHKIARAQ